MASSIDTLPPENTPNGNAGASQAAEKLNNPNVASHINTNSNNQKTNTEQMNFTNGSTDGTNKLHSFGAVKFNLLSDFVAFGSTPIGILIKNMIESGKARNIAALATLNPVVKYLPSFDAYNIEVGDAVITYVTNVLRPDCTGKVYNYASTAFVKSQPNYGMTGNPYTQLALHNIMAHDCRKKSYITIYEDELRDHYNAIADFLCKAIIPNEFRIVEEEDLIHDGAIIKDTERCPECTNEIINFINRYGISNSIVPTMNKFAALYRFIPAQNNSKNQFDAFADGVNGFGINNGMQFGGQFNFGNSFAGGMQFGGVNQFGGFNPGFGGMQFGFGSPMIPEILGAIRYIELDETIPNTNQKGKVMYITEIVEHPNYRIRDMLNYFFMTFAQLNKYIAIKLSLDISKLSLDIKETWFKEYMLNDTAGQQQSYYGYYGYRPQFNYTGLIQHVIYENGMMKRYVPQYITLSYFKHHFSAIASDPKFPTNLNTIENKELFEQFKTKAGFINIAYPGYATVVFNQFALPSIVNKYNMTCFALSQGMSLKEMIEKQNKGQNQKNNQQQQTQQSFGGAFGGFGGFNPGFGGNQFGFNAGMGFNQGMNGGYNMNYGQYGNPMMSNGMMYNQNPMMGNNFGAFGGAQPGNQQNPQQPNYNMGMGFNQGMNGGYNMNYGQYGNPMMSNGMMYNQNPMMYGGGSAFPNNKASGGTTHAYIPR